MISDRINSIINAIDVIIKARPRSQLFRYYLKRILGEHNQFTEDIFVHTEGLLFNCGRYIENCKVAVSSFEPEVQKIISSNNWNTFIDVGSHIGKYSITLGKKGSKVYAVEADKRNYDLLLKNLKLNNIRNAEAFNILCGEKKGAKIFYSSNNHPATNSINPLIDSSKTEKQMDCLDNLIKEIKTPCLMKIDVEGSELLVLNGSRKLLEAFRPTIIFEAWDNTAFVKISSFLKSFGYSFKRLDEYNYMAYT